MKFSILIEMLFDLLAKRKLTATYFAEKYGISTRTVYRYIDTLSLGAIPVQVQRGRDGGICISDSYKLPRGFMTKDEYEATIEALSAMYSQFPEVRFLDARRKLSAQIKSENRDFSLSGDVGSILVDGGTWGDSGLFAEKLQLLEECIKERLILDIEYQSRVGEKTARKIEPHVLVFKQNVWYIYAFCHKKREFRLFRVGRVISSIKTEERFIKRPFTREDIPLRFDKMESNFIDVRFSIQPQAFADAQDWLGAESLRQIDGQWFADVTLPDDDGLINKIIGLGEGIQVLSPLTLKNKVIQTLSNILQSYAPSL